MIDEPRSHNYLQFLNTDKLVSIQEHEKYTFCRVKKDLELKDYNVGVASAIASYARLKLHSLLTAIRKVGGKIHYCDTDSVICDINLCDYPELKRKFQWDGDGSELGSVKNECDDYVQSICAKAYPDDKDKQKQELERLRAKENGNFSFDRGVILG